jgi:hypothetical protein
MDTTSFVTTTDELSIEELDTIGGAESWPPLVAAFVNGFMSTAPVEGQVSIIASAWKH